MKHPEWASISVPPHSAWGLQFWSEYWCKQQLTVTAGVRDPNSGLDGCEPSVLPLSLSHYASKVEQELLQDSSYHSLHLYVKVKATPTSLYPVLMYDCFLVMVKLSVRLNIYFFTSYGLAWNTTTGSVSMLYTTVSLVFVLSWDDSEELILTTGAIHNRDLNPGYHDC